MINYLNNPKRLFVALTTTAALAGSLSLASCNDYDAMNEEGIKEMELQATLKEYAKNFEERYGVIDKNHTWGFENVTVTGTPITKAATRAAEPIDAAEPSQQIWYATYHVSPPGAPADWNGNEYQTVPGSVTSEEILWVSEYFRTHNYNEMIPDMVQLHLTDFFIESISKDKDQNSYDAHGLGDERTFDGFNGVTYGMDHLICRTMESTDDYSTWHHINDFNAGNTVPTPQQYADTEHGDYYNPKDEEGHYALDLVYSGTNKSHERNRTIMYVHSSGTESFAYRPSWGTEEKEYRELYVLVHLSFTVNGNHYEGNYLAFDFDDTNSGNHVEADGKYSNWIVKISPANYIPQNNGIPCRIFCEDLGNTHDFDFNDVVFDLNYEVNWGTGTPKVDAIIKLQAAGGTMKIFVGKLDEKYEAHKMLGQSTHIIPVNVGKGKANVGVSHDVAIYRVDVTDLVTIEGNEYYYTLTADPNDIPIYVVSNSNAATPTITLLPASGKGDNYVPQKFSVPNTTTRWTKEDQQIEWAYKLFDSWVGNDHGYREWFESGQMHSATVTPWYSPSDATKIDATYLY